MTRLEIIGLPLDHEVALGDDLAELARTAAARADVVLRSGDVIAVASKIVAKSEGAVVPLPVGGTDAARRTLARAEATEIVADSERVLIVRTRHGFVTANAGIDTSNVPRAGTALLLPEDPDASAERLRARLAELAGVDVGVVVTDTFGRPWRDGLVDVALGAAGVRVLRDERGGTDRNGRSLGVTVVATGDQVAAAADLVRSKADGTPFVLVRGLPVDQLGDDTAARLVRPLDQDLFRRGGTEAITASLDAARHATGDDARVDAPAPDAAAVRRVADAAAAAVMPVTTTTDRSTVVISADDPVAVGAAIQAATQVAASLGLRWNVARSHDGARLSLRSRG